MRRKLSEMDLEELWQLFPIYLTEHNDNWSVWYADEERYLEGYFPAGWMKRISHIGSTAIKGIWAKPTIDILAEVVPECDLQQVKPILEQAGYLFVYVGEFRAVIVQQRLYRKRFCKTGFSSASAKSRR